MAYPHAEQLAMEMNRQVRLQSELKAAEQRVNKLQRLKNARRAAELLKQEIQAMRLPFTAMTDDERAVLQVELKERVRHRYVLYPFTSGGIQI